MWLPLMPSTTTCIKTFLHYYIYFISQINGAAYSLIINALLETAQLDLLLASLSVDTSLLVLILRGLRVIRLGLSGPRLLVFAASSSASDIHWCISVSFESVNTALFRKRSRATTATMNAKTTNPTRAPITTF